MKITSLAIPDVKLIEVNVFADSRGYFFESFRKEIFENEIGRIDFVQENESKSFYGTLRGLHYQAPPFSQSKLVRVIEGEIIDVAVDLRKNSPTLGQHVSIKLSSENKKQLFIPQGFAHGFVTLSDFAIFQYKVDNYYSKAHERGVIYNDPEIAVDWGFDKEKLIISDKDFLLPRLEEAEVFSY